VGNVYSLYIELLPSLFNVRKKTATKTNLQGQDC